MVCGHFSQNGVPPLLDNQLSALLDSWANPAPRARQTQFGEAAEGIEKSYRLAQSEQIGEKSLQIFKEILSDAICDRKCLLDGLLGPVRQRCHLFCRACDEFWALDALYEAFVWESCERPG